MMLHFLSLLLLFFFESEIASYVGEKKGTTLNVDTVGGTDFPLNPPPSPSDVILDPHVKLVLIAVPDLN